MINNNLGEITFKLSVEFVNKYKNIPPPFGFNGLGLLVYMRTYSRLKKNGQNEQWYETVERVVNGVYSMQKNHILNYGLGWNQTKGQQSAQEMYDRMFNMKFLPPGRGLWAMGTDITTKGIFAALNNCAFVSTENIKINLTKPFEFLMDMSMLGVGVGFDVKGEGKIIIQKPSYAPLNYIIPDTREGWVESVKLALLAYFKGTPFPTFDYSLIRAEGEPIKTFGGTACGPEPLHILHNQIIDTLDPTIGQPISITQIVDLMNMIGCCVVAGNVRRTAEIVFGPYDSEEYLKLKDYNWNGKEMEGTMKHRSSYGWASNNTIFANLGMDYDKVGKQIGKNGEPGLSWLNNMQDYGRMIEKPNYKDKKVKGGNPCLEQSLEDFELCCLVETFPNACDDKEDFLRTLKFAYLYAKTVTLGQTHWEETNRVMLRNRRIGTSQSGIVQTIASIGINNYKEWCEEGYKTIQMYDEQYSDWLCIPKSIKTTSVKPSGTISLLRGDTPGMHYPESTCYIRRVRISKHSLLLEKYINAGYKVEQSVSDINSMIIEVPILIEGIRTVNEVSIWEQVSLAAFMQKYWADNQVSCTVTFKPDLSENEKGELNMLQGYQNNTKFQEITKEGVGRFVYLKEKQAKSEASQIPSILNYFQYQLKGISFLPKTEKGAYAQMPYEEISIKTYQELIKNIKPVVIDNLSEDSTPEKYCDGDQCSIN